MKGQLFLVLFLVVAVYVIWTFTAPKERARFRQLFTKHFLRLGALIVVVLLLLAAAVNLPATGIL